jgi:branched-chain amino acid transport system permease protein
LVFLLSMMIVGGRGTTWGPIVGSAALMTADYQFQSMGGWRTGALAAITILFLVVYPRGLVGALSSLAALIPSIARPGFGRRHRPIQAAPKAERS